MGGIAQRRKLVKKKKLSIKISLLSNGTGEASSSGSLLPSGSPGSSPTAEKLTMTPATVAGAVIVDPVESASTAGGTDILDGAGKQETPTGLAQDVAVRSSDD